MTPIPETSFWGLSITQWTAVLALGTFALAFVTGALVYLNYWMLRKMDRPHLSVEWRTLVLRDWDHPTSNADPVVRSLAFDVKNFGRSPARPTRLPIHAVVHYLNQLEEEKKPTYRDAQAERVGGAVYPDQTMHWQYDSREALALSDDALKQWKTRVPTRLGDLFLYGFMEYLDVHNRAHRSYFGVRYVDWEPNKDPYWVVVTDPQWWRTT
jgi:hypothetical protein